MNIQKKNIIPNFFRVGQFVESEFAFALPLLNTNGLYFKPKEKSNRNLLNLIQRLALNLHLDIDKKQLDIFVFDIGQGDINFPFLRDLYQETSNISYITSKGKFVEIINQLIEKSHDISLNYLTKTIPNIASYNENSDLKEKYRLLLFTDNSALNLIPNDKQDEFKNVLKQGEKFGFYFVFANWKNDNSNNYRNNNTFSDINFGTSIIILNNNYMLDKDIHHLKGILNKYKIETDHIKDDELREIYQKIMEKNIDENSLEEDDIVIQLGTNGSRIINFSLGKKSSCYHTFISGQIGMGKSNILNTIILQIGLTYSPKQVELYLIDFKGTEFALYDKHPNVRILQTDTDLTKTYFILHKIKTEGETRKQILKNNAKDIQEYNRKNPDNKLPIILIIVDEFQSIFDLTERSNNKDINSLFKEVARTYRSCGIYFILCTQKINDEKIDQDIISQTQVRIFTATTDFLSNRLLDSRNNFDLKKLSMGQALYNNKNGTKEGNHFVNINYAGDTAKILSQIETILKNNSRVFELINIDEEMNKN